MAVKDLWNKKARDISYAWFMIRFSSAKLRGTEDKKEEEEDRRIVSGMKIKTMSSILRQERLCPHRRR